MTNKEISPQETSITAEEAIEKIRKGEINSDADLRGYGLKVNPSPEGDPLKKEKKDPEGKEEWRRLSWPEVLEEYGPKELDIRPDKTTGNPEG